MYTYSQWDSLFCGSQYTLSPCLLALSHSLSLLLNQNLLKWEIQICKESLLRTYVCFCLCVCVCTRSVCLIFHHICVHSHCMELLWLGKKLKTKAVTHTNGIIWGCGCTRNNFSSSLLLNKHKTFHKSFGEQFCALFYFFKWDRWNIYFYVWAVYHFVVNRINRSTITNLQRVKHKLIHTNFECTYIHCFF